MQQIANPLADWMKNRSQADFARQIGVSATHLSLVLKNKRGVSQRTALQIEEKTKGAVTMAALAKLEVNR